MSKKKRRHKEPGFDLDLSYITSRIIAMGFPSTGNEGIFRNHADHVTEFLRVKHGDKVKVYNLCSERDYPVSLFNGRVAKYPFDDHNPPPLQMFLPFCEDVKEWLDSDPENVVAIHCKAGKGRTGVMICAYLLYIGEWDDADECMAFYGSARTYNGKGVTIPSQKRFIRHFADLCRGIGPHFASNVGTRITYADEAGNSKEEHCVVDTNADVESGSEDEIETETALVCTTDEDVVCLGDDRHDTAAITSADSCDNKTGLGSGVDRSVIVTPQGAVFTDYSESGTNLEDNLKRARAAASSSKVGKRPTYAQASFWMTSHQDIVHKIFLDTGVPGGLLGSSLDLEVDDGRVLALEDSKTAELEDAEQKVRGRVPPPVVLAVVGLRLSAVPQLNIRGTFQPVLHIQGAGYSIMSTDFLPMCTYRGRGAVTFAIPGIFISPLHLQFAVDTVHNYICRNQCG